MNIEQLATFIVRNAWLLLAAAIALLMLIGMSLRWFIERHGETLWRVVAMLWRWLNGYLPLSRLNRFSYIGVHLVLGFALALGAAAGFISLAEEISEAHGITRLDTAVADAFRSTGEPGRLEPFLVLTRLGDTSSLVAIGVVIFVALIAMRRRLYSLCWAAATLGNALLIYLLKNLFGRERPAYEHGLVSADSWSFPSGHAAGSMVVYGMLAYLLLRESRRAWHPLIFGLAVSLIASIGFSRVVLHVHYLSDVLAGYASGLLWLTVIITACEIAMTHYARSRDSVRGAATHG